MKVTEGLEEIRSRLVANGAQPESVKVVSIFLTRASLPAAQTATAGSLLQLVRMLIRSPQANANPAVYNDFVRLEEELEAHAGEARARREAEDARPIPKTKKFYKSKKEHA